MVSECPPRPAGNIGAPFPQTTATVPALSFLEIKPHLHWLLLCLSKCPWFLNFLPHEELKLFLGSSWLLFSSFEAGSAYICPFPFSGLQGKRGLSCSQLTSPLFWCFPLAASPVCFLCSPPPLCLDSAKILHSLSSLPSLNKHVPSVSTLATSLLEPQEPSKTSFSSFYNKSSLAASPSHSHQLLSPQAWFQLSLLP